MKPSLTSLLVLGTLFSGCQKFVDLVHRHDDHNRIPCKITRTTYVDSLHKNSTNIHYNTEGYPISVDYSLFELFIPDPERPDTIPILLEYKFDYSYDAQKRLISETSDFFYAERMMHYAYEGNARLPVRDSFPGVVGDEYVEDLEYDFLNRITKVTLRTIVSRPDGEVQNEARKYFYDIRGNRQEDPSNPNYPGEIIYNNKPSLYSLHPVWQLIHKDFSKNSVDYGATYNSKGLPLTIKREPVPYFQPFVGVGAGYEITYECD
ncbi:MAG TPA: hypothetical protein VK625_02365 [Flavitalea sp.]|nr:hypothetical protein [Flavitalea sp.]